MNATSTYTRLAVTFVLGLFFTWFLVGRVGIAGYGIMALAGGAFGISAAIESAISNSMSRELAKSLSTGDVEEVRRTFVSAFGVSAIGSIVIFALVSLIAAIAWSGRLFNLPESSGDLDLALGALFLAAGISSGFRILLSPYQQSLYAAQRVVIDNGLRVLSRVMQVVGVVLAFGLFWRDEPLDVQLLGYAAVRVVVMSIDVLVAVILAKRLIRGLDFRLTYFDRQEFRAIGGTCWHTGQMMILMDFNPQIMMLLINLFFGVTYNGIWQIVLQVGGHAQLVAEGLLKGIDPISAHLQTAGKYQLVLKLMKRSIRYQLAIALPWMLIYIIFMIPILNLWIADRLEQDTGLIESGISVEQAIQVIALMASVYLLAILSRAATRGIERILYGIGEVRAYAWFAKYAIMLSIGGGAALFWLTDNPLLAPLPIVIVNALYYGVIIPFAAKKRARLPLRRTVAESIPRPILASGLLAVILLIMKPYFMDLNLFSLVILLGIAGITYIPLCYIIVIRPDERLRILEMIGGILKRRYSER